MTYLYDTNGNIVSKTPYTNVTTTDLTTATAGTAIAYGYTDSTWSDKLTTSYNGQSIVYDASGNPTSYKGATLTWNGRLLTSYENGADRYEYGYNSDGLRVSKKVFDNGTLSQSQKYVWSDGKLVGMKVYNPDSTKDSFIRYLYDENNEAVGMKFEEFTFLFVKNLQGDVISILKAETDEACLNLTYDAWDKVSIHPVSQNLGAIIGAILVAGLNNFTYRGYFCDYDTGLYYLQSRYYDSETGRFINADDTEYLGANGTPNSYNLFVYCENNPVNFCDYCGCSPFDFLRNKDNGFFGFYNTGTSFKDFFTKSWTTIKCPWQMKTGYNNIYNQGAKFLFMYIDWIISEFNYNGKQWRVELWKGRYGISVGAEIGIYNNPKSFKGFNQWECAIDNELYMVLMLLYIKKIDGEYHAKEVFLQQNSHWWLTGFKASVDITKAGPQGNRLMVLAQIDFNSPAMANLFAKNLNGKGYFFTGIRDSSVLVFWFSKNYGEVYID